MNGYTDNDEMIALQKRASSAERKLALARTKASQTKKELSKAVDLLVRMYDSSQALKAVFRHETGRGVYAGAFLDGCDTETKTYLDSLVSKGR